MFTLEFLIYRGIEGPNGGPKIKNKNKKRYEFLRAGCGIYVESYGWMKMEKVRETKIRGMKMKRVASLCRTGCRRWR